MGCYPGLGEQTCELSAELPVAGTEFGDAASGGFREAAEGSADPALIAHQEVDPPEVPAAAAGFRIVRRQVVEEFRDDLACRHRAAG